MAPVHYALNGLMSYQPGSGAFPLVGPLAEQPPASAGSLADAIAAGTRARQQDFATGYLGGNISGGFWEPMLQEMSEPESMNYKGSKGTSFQPTQANLPALGMDTTVKDGPFGPSMALAALKRGY